ncbi:MAG: ribulose-phosphate 3-epimerase [Chloracidobacterium sp.]|uniref:Ribulose-phosphate 3-epimerase n=1 Tax=Chloracidobacterium validum TaxID=2821543 RepID=A0ABX8B7P0_9BACT|nr:ribulose-phosphate 3-epimerase [Chloracidobacterium validum]QUW02462.1 ribulose-phosphate 3-epimerase [Chloracidobacterium validum]
MSVARNEPVDVLSGANEPLAPGHPITEVKIAPSILSADFARLGDEVGRVEAAGADMIHVDVMDGHYVPNLTIGPPVVAALRKVTHLPLDVHLMMTNPDAFLKDFREAGADSISVHVEVVHHLHRTLDAIRALGARPGVVLNPGTSLALLDEILPFTDFVLLMTVNPGFGGQRFIEACLPKVARLRQMIDARGLQVAIEVDGGIGRHNIRALVEQGATWIVAGSSIFGAPDPGLAVQQLRAAATGAGYATPYAAV